MSNKKISLSIYGLSVLDEKNQRVYLTQGIGERGLLAIIEDYIRENMSQYSKDTSKEILLNLKKLIQRLFLTLKDKKPIRFFMEE